MPIKKGEIIPVEITGKLLKDENGRLIGLQGSTKDISERYEVQNELKKQHALLRTLIDNIPDPIYVKDLSGRYILNNSGHQKELLASSQEELFLKSDQDFFDEAIGEIGVFLRTFSDPGPVFDLPGYGSLVDFAINFGLFDEIV